jgi:hypothetical protein
MEDVRFGYEAWSFEERKRKGGPTAFVDVGAKARLSAPADKALIRRSPWGRCSVIGSGVKNSKRSGSTDHGAFN